jgi:branched-chain amino acid transport system ATP-binding protein
VAVAIAAARTGGAALMSTPLLEARGVGKLFGGVQALQDVSLHIEGGEIYGLIGPNGAGKTTFFNCLTGLYQPELGNFRFAGRVLRAAAPQFAAAAGIARTFQNIRLFANMSACENVMIGRHVRTHAGLWGAIIRDRATRAEETAIRRRAEELLHYVGIADRADDLACNLSYGDQRRLEIARALATEPRLLCLDEPAAGMNATETDELRTLVEGIRSDGITVLLIEHDVKLVMGLCDRVAVLDYGKLICEDAPAMVQRDPHVIEAYLGA